MEGTGVRMALGVALGAPVIEMGSSVAIGVSVTSSSILMIDSEGLGVVSVPVVGARVVVMTGEVVGLGVAEMS